MSREKLISLGSPWIYLKPSFIYLPEWLANYLEAPWLSTWLSLWLSLSLPASPIYLYLLPI